MYIVIYVGWEQNLLVGIIPVQFKKKIFELISRDSLDLAIKVGIFIFKKKIVIIILKRKDLFCRIPYTAHGAQTLPPLRYFLFLFIFCFMLILG